MAYLKSDLTFAQIFKERGRDSDMFLLKAALSNLFGKENIDEALKISSHNKPQPTKWNILLGAETMKIHRNSSAKR